MRTRVVLVVLLLGLVGLVAVVHDGGREDPGASLQRSGGYDPHDRRQVIDTFYDVWLANQQVPLGWTGSRDGCRPGRVSSAAQAATLSQVNYFRTLVGLRRVRFDDATAGLAQRTALIMDANMALSHFPPRSWRCRTQAGAWLASRSNLALGTAGRARGAQAVTRYVEDAGARNRQVGHRRWLFSPRTAVMASGTTGRANALVVVGMPQHRAAVPSYLRWPSAGYFPAPLEPRGRWSLSASRRGTDFSRARVQVVGPDGRRLAVERYPVRNGMGPNTLVWKVGDLVRPTVTTDVSYRVRVSGIRRGGRVLAPVAWTVTLVRPDRALTPVQAPEVIGTYAVGETVFASAGTWSRTPDRLSYQWLRDGEPIPGQVYRFYRLALGDEGHRIGVRVRAAADYFQPAVAEVAGATVGPRAATASAAPTAAP